MMAHKSRKFHGNIHRRGLVDSGSAKKKDFSVGPVMLGFFVFVVIVIVVVVVGASSRRRRKVTSARVRGVETTRENDSHETPVEVAAEKKT